MFFEETEAAAALRARMREDWDARAREDAERFIYTRDRDGEVADFGASGRANYRQLIRPYLPMLLGGRAPREGKVVEIGCGAGRMTQWLARDFGLVEAVDVSPEMIALGRERLASLGNIRWHAGNGIDLSGVADESADLVFSYIVFQHVPSREVVAGYVREAARVLRAGGMVKFQVSGDQSAEYVAHVPDTWLGVTFSGAEVAEMAAGAGLTVVALEGAGTQYLVATASKGAFERRWVLGGDGDEWFGEGFGAAVEGSWRPVAGSRARVRMPAGIAGRRVYVGLYFWPGSERCVVRVGGSEIVVEEAGDQYFEGEWAGGDDLTIEIVPAPAKGPAFRIAGVY